MLLTERQYARVVTYLPKLQEQEKALVKWVNEAAAQGDLAENSEFDAARLELEKTRNKITEMQEIVASAEIVQPNPNPCVIDIGSLVKIQIRDTGISALDAGEVHEISGVQIPDTQIPALPITSIVGKRLYGRQFDPDSSLANTITYTDVHNITRELIILDVNNVRGIC